MIIPNPLTVACAQGQVSGLLVDIILKFSWHMHKDIEAIGEEIAASKQWTSERGIVFEILAKSFPGANGANGRLLDPRVHCSPGVGRNLQSCKSCRNHALCMP